MGGGRERYLPLLELLDGAPVTVGLTPVLCDQLEAMRGDPGIASSPTCARSRPRIHAEDADGLERGGEPGWPTRCAARPATTSARRPPSSAASGDLLGALRGARAGRAVDLAATHARAAAAGHRRRHQAAAGGRRRARTRGASVVARRLLAARVRLRAGPRARSSPITACAPSASTRLTALGHGAPSSSSRSPPKPARWRSRSTGDSIELVWDAATATRPTPPTATTTAARSTTCSRGTTAAAPYDHAEALALARRACARLRGRAPSAPGRRRPALLRARHRAARPLVVRGHGLACGRAGGGRANRASQLVTVSEGLERHAGGRARAAASTWGSGKDMSTWDAPRVADLALGAARGGAGDGGAAARGNGDTRAALTAPPASCSRCRPATGPSWSPAISPPTIRRERVRGPPPAARRRACAL